MNFLFSYFKKPILCTAKMTIILLLANLLFLTYVYGQDSISKKEYVNVVSARQEYLIKPIFEAFTKETGIKVNYSINNADEIITMIKDQAEETQADAFLAVDASDLYEAQQIGILQTIRSKLLEKNIPPHLKDPSRQWFGLSLRVRSLVYHTKRVNTKELLNFRDLGNDKWNKRLALRTSTRIYNKSMVAMMIAKYGYKDTKSIIKSWINNLAIPPLDSDVEVIENILKDKADIGIINSYYLAKMIKDNPSLPLKMHWIGDEQGKVHVNISGIGILRYAKRKENAIKLLEWLSSKKGQKLFAEIDMEYPVNKEVSIHNILKQWGEFKHSNINVKKAGELRSQAVKLMKEVGYK